MDRFSALHLLHEYVTSESIRRHCYAVAASMEAYAEKYHESKDAWWITGLLHDFDYEKYPTIPEHVTEGVKILKAKGYLHEMIEAIQGHVDYLGVPRKSLMAKTLFAVDELSGFVVALAKVRQDRFTTMDAESVKKALKKKGFAAAINRDYIEKGIAELEVNKEEHFNLVIHALKKIQKDLGFT
ncbi:HDIG domain-containing protein [Candidatus Pacearchaeota archaeon]|nr:HDIG domain-containing protein [Candidatus Pacearchaeota archaeon]